ncbi:MAG: hypothetical protein ACJAT2_000854 [Bacteriovoracaceae bacterium]|jgi:hypothetical protein
MGRYESLLSLGAVDFPAFVLSKVEALFFGRAAAALLFFLLEGFEVFFLTLAIDLEGEAFDLTGLSAFELIITLDLKLGLFERILEFTD